MEAKEEESDQIECLTNMGPVNHCLLPQLSGKICQDDEELPCNFTLLNV